MARRARTRRRTRIPIRRRASPRRSRTTRRSRSVREGVGGGTLANARLYVGHYEARVSPIADTNPATSGDEPRRHGGLRTRHVRVRGPRARLRARAVPRATAFRPEQGDHGASSHGTGRPAASRRDESTGDGVDLGNLIDDTENTNWNAPGTVTTGNLTVDGKQATVDLAGTDDVTVRFVQVSAHIRVNGQSRFAALRQFQLQACNADEGDNCSTAAGFTRCTRARRTPSQATRRGPWLRS